MTTVTQTTTVVALFPPRFPIYLSHWFTEVHFRENSAAASLNLSRKEAAKASSLPKKLLAQSLMHKKSAIC